MVVMGFVVTLLFGCSGDKKPAIHGADVDVSQAQLVTVISVDELPSPDGKERLRFVVYAENAHSIDQRAQTAMALAIGAAKAGAYEVLVWLEAEPKLSRRLAVADYYPYGDTAFGKPAPHIWDVYAYKTGDENNPIAPFPVYFHQ
jgi:hypothetical protein